MDGKAILFTLFLTASSILFVYAPAKSLSSPCFPSRYMGPTAWITCFAFRLPPVVITALPVGQPPIFLHSSIIFGPPALWMAPSTPPQPASLELAAFTIASVSSWVMSPLMRERIVELMVVCMFRIHAPCIIMKLKGQCQRNSCDNIVKKERGDMKNWEGLNWKRNYDLSALSWHQKFFKSLSAQSRV